MSIFTKIFLAYFLFLSFLKAQTFENVVPNIYILNSCSKQAHISIRFENEYEGFGNIKDSLIVVWKKSEKVIKEGKPKGLLVTELGVYSCEIKLKNQVIVSNKLELVTFENDIPFGYNFVGPSFYRQPICFQESFWKNTYTNTNFYYFRAPSLDYNIQKVISDSINVSLNWIIDDQIFEHNAIKTIPSSNNYTSKVRLNINEGQCNFFSNEREVHNEPLVFKPNKAIYEYCEGDTAVILGKMLSNFGKIDKSTWYKDDKIFFEVISDHTNSNEANLITTQPGKYTLKKTITQKFENGIPVFDENSCVYWQDTITVVFKNSVELKKSNYISNFLPSYQKLDKIFCDSPAAELVTDSLTQNFNWFRNDILIPKNEYILSKKEVKWADYVKQKTLYFNQIKLIELGSYYAKINYGKNCVISTDTINYKGETKFDLINPNLCSQLNFPDFSMDWAVKNGWPNKTVWKRDGKEILYDELKNLNSGTFQAILTFNNGCIMESNPIYLEVNTINSELNITDSLQLCPGTQAKLFLKDTVSNFTIYDLVKNGTFQKIKGKDFNINKSGNYQILFKDNICNNYLLSNSVKIIEIPLPTATISGSKSIDYGANAELKLDLTSTPPWQIKLNTGQEFLVEKTPFNITVKPQIDTKYTLESVKNICGIGTSSGEATIKVIILANEPNLNKELEMSTYPIPVNDTFEVEIRNAKENKIEILLYDFLGKNVISTEIFKENGKFIKTLNTNNLAAGIYILKAEIDGKIISKKIVKN